MRYKRADRVAALLKEEVSRILLRDIKDPELQFVTITKVKLSDDLRHAKMYYSVLKNTDIARVQKGLDRANSFIRGEIGHRLNLRYVPSFKFYYDDSADYADRIDSLLKKIR